MSTAWKSKVTKHYKNNAIIGVFNRSKRISMKFDDEIKHIKAMPLKADYSLRFVDSIIWSFQSANDTEDSLIIPTNLFDKGKHFHFAERMKINQKIPPLHKWKISYSINWITKKLKSLFPLKHKNIYIHPARSAMDYALVRRTILANQNVIWQLNGENITNLLMILGLKNI